MLLTIEIKDNAIDKIMYFLENLKDDADYQYIVKGREERKKYPENYLTEDAIEWD